jgi:hypothetical protein
VPVRYMCSGRSRKSGTRKRPLREEPEVAHHLRAYLIATLADGRAHGRVQVFRLRAEFSRHFFDGGARHSRSCAAPSGMNGRNRPGPRIGNQNGHAIRRTHSDPPSDFVRDQRVALALAVREAVAPKYNIRVNLAQRQGRVGREPITRVPCTERMVEPFEFKQRRTL